ncbi:SusC/RagA family TonB-linked outer membrane protein [Ferruginibacter sp.]|nr:SusC/RagA family TonB-linked outer membrane protein [Ferruginibacter sp.]
MRRFLSLFTMLMLCGVLAFAQSRVVSGKVTDKDGNPVPFASVKVKGSKTGIAADANGQYTIKVKQGDFLEISGSGYKLNTISVDNQSFIQTSLERGATSELTEVVITSGYGVKASARRATSNTQVISAEKLNIVRSTNVNDALSGKVSGIQFRGQSAGKLGSNGSLRLRGEGNLGGGSSVLYVVDGTRVSVDDVNMDDVEDVTVLQGPNAAAIFGPDGANGAIVITTRKAKKTQKGIGIEVNSGAQFDKVYILPNYQNSYAGGDMGYSGYDMYKYTWQSNHPVEWKALDGKYYHDYAEDVSWGPRMVGQEYIPWYSWYGGHERSYKTASLTPQPNNARTFYNTGERLNNSVTLTKAGDNFNTRFTYNNINVKGILPNTDLKRNTFSTNTTVDLSNKLSLGINLNYYNQVNNGDFDDGYSNNTSGSFNQWFHRDLDMGIIKELKDLRTPTGIRASWNHSNPSAYNSAKLKDFYGAYYWYSFDTWQELVTNVSEINKLYGDISLTYKINNDLRVKGTYRTTTFFGHNERKYSTDLFESGTKTFSNCVECNGYYSSFSGNSKDQDLELTATYNKTLKDFTIGATAGLDIHSYSVLANQGNTNGGLNIPNLFTLTNSKQTASFGDTRLKEKDNAVFVTGQIGFRRFLNFDFTLRNDWLSTLPPATNDILSKSFGGSFIFSDLLKIPFLSSGKIRASWGETPQSLGNGRRTSGIFTYPGAQYFAGSSNLWNGNFLQGVNSGSVDPAISGAVAKQAEVGIDLAFLKNRLGFSVSYYKYISKDFPQQVAVYLPTGTSSYTTNSGEINKEGIDVQFNARPLAMKNLSWDITATWAYLLSNKVVDIDGDPTTDKGRQVVESIWGSGTPYLVHLDGQQWGTMFGNGKKRDAAGNPLLDGNGNFVTDANVNYGNVLPKYTGGVQNSFTVFGNFTINANIDYQLGGKFFSLSDMWGSYTGVLARTAGVNDKGNPMRDPVAQGGGTHVFGVDQTTLKPVDYYVNTRLYYENLYGNKIFDDYVYDLTFVKLREVSLGYNIPVAKLGIGKWITRANFSIIARQPLLIYAKNKDFDPSEISNLSGEAGGFPGTRSLGVNLKLGF